MTTVSEIVKAIETFAPAGTAQSYDNVGLQMGRLDAEVTGGLISLDLTPAVIREAIEGDLNLIVTHHPVLFHGQKSITDGTLIGSMLLTAAESGISIVAAHTNLDAARGGVSFVLAEALGLDGIQFLEPLADTLLKLVVFVPRSHADAIRAALESAGAGRIGEYSGCSFTSEGLGSYRPSAKANPYSGGGPGELASKDEDRIEMEVERWNIDRAVAAMKAVHPYEQPAFDVFPTESGSSNYGMGAIGQLPDPVRLDAFLETVADALGCASLRFVGEPAALLRKVAVCGGSGAGLSRRAMAAGADAYVTADITYHRFFDVLDPAGRSAMALIDVGHYESERPAEQLLVDLLSKSLQSVQWTRTSCRTSPVDTFVARTNQTAHQ